MTNKDGGSVVNIPIIVINGNNAQPPIMASSGEFSERINKVHSQIVLGLG